jgi:outer membrane biosynthesis protein TonB
MITVSQLKMEYDSPEAIREKKSRRIAFFSALGFYAIVFIILLIVKFTPPNPPWQAPGGGAEIILGTDELGMNNTEESVASPSHVQQTQVVSAPPTPEPQTIQDEADPESAPIATPQKQPEPKVKEVTQHTQVTPKPQAQEPQPTVNQNALFSKKSGTGTDPNGTASSKGTGYTPGNQGGNGNGHSWMGGGTGEGTGSGIGLGGDLAGRGVVALPAPEKNYVEGKVVVEVCIDQDGNVISARGGGKGSTITNPATVEEAEKKAKASKFKADPDAPAMQCGQIIYNFRPQ